MASTNHMKGGRNKHGALWILRKKEKVTMICTRTTVESGNPMLCCDRCPFFREPRGMLKPSDIDKKKMVPSGLVSLELCSGNLVFDTFEDDR